MAWLAGVSLAVSSPLAAAQIHTMEALTITPTQNPTLKIEEAPVPVTVIGPDELAEKSVATIGDIFRHTPGVDAISAGPGSIMPVIRGLSHEQVLVLVDGVRLSDERPGGNHVLSIDPAQIERVEIVRGPGSVLYGAGAIGGVVNFITKKAAKKRGDETRVEGDVGLQFENNGNGFRQKAHISAGMDDINLYAGGTHKKSSNLESPDEEIRFSDYDGSTLWTGGNYLTDHWTTELNLWQSKADIGIAAPRTFVSDYYKDETHTMVNGKIAYEPDSDILERFELLASWQEHNRHRIREPKPDGLVDIKVDKDTRTLRAQFVLTPVQSHRLTTGAEYYNESLDSSRAIKNLPTAPGFDGVPVLAPSARTGYGLYLQDEFAAAERLNLTAGLRYDTIEAKTDGAPSPYYITTAQFDRDSALSGSIGLVYKAAEPLTLFVNVGRAFRSPTIIERYFYGPHDGPGQDIGNPNLNPEKSWNFDAGVRYGNGNFIGSLSLFYTRVDDMIRKILSNPDAASPTEYRFLYQNIADARLYGGEADGEYFISDEVSTFGSLSVVRGDDITHNKPLTQIPPIKIRYGVRYTGYLFTQEFWSELSGVSALRQKRAGTGEKETPGYTTADIRLGIITEQGVSATVAAENLFDATTYDHLSYAWQELDYATPGRNIKLDLSYRF